MLNIYISGKDQVEDENFNIDQTINDSVGACLDEEGINYIDKDVEVYIEFVSASKMKEINKAYRQVDKTTDVLSFPLMSDDDIGLVILGDIFINYEQIKSQASLYSRTSQEELAYMVVHSSLHLLGYDHADDHEEDIMRKKECEILESIGISLEK